TVASYSQDPTGTLAGSAALSVTGTAALAGGTVSGHLLGSTTSSGSLLVSGSLGGGALSVTGGTLTLTGTSTNSPVAISAPAALVDANGGLDAAAAVTNAGTLTVNTADTVASYSQDPTGTLAGSAALTVSGAATLKGGAITGSLLGNTINLTSGVLTQTGTLGTATTHLDIAAGATLVAAGTQRYSLLTTTGTGAATWQGILTNTATLAPGGAGGTGTLQVTSGNFTNAAGAVLKLDIAAAGHDLLATTGSANFGGTLDLNQVGTTAAAAFVPIHVVDAATYTGNFTTLTENLDGAVWFNPGNGDVIRIAVPQGSTLFGSTTNQTATWVALYDDVIDPGVTNVFANPGGTPSYGITSGIANGNNPDLLWALAASFTPTGLNANLLNHLSPEVYVGLADYATQATRTHQRSAFSAPALAPAAPGKADSKGGSKDAAPAKQQWELFAAADYFNVRSAGSQNQADYELSDSGILAGVRGKLTDHSHVAAYLAADTGNIDGALIHADSTGWSLGLLGEATLDEATTTRLSAGISYGRYSFDGTRNSAAAGSSGWIPATAGFSNATADSLELFVGVEGLAYHNDHIRLIPAFGLRAACGTMNSFSESNYSTAGSPIALAVAADHYNSALAELSLRAEADLTHKLGLSAEAGLSAGIGDDPHTLTARFAKGSRAFQASADGISNDNIFLGLGATYKVSDSISVALGYRAEFRSDAGTFNGVHLASSFRF
ncbi:MAG: autotransporter outer membrane beta-barrel domain-containing protein, partial [Verrucomicrobiota bacterium]